jgi:hypothetical protein
VQFTINKNPEDFDIAASTRDEETYAAIASDIVARYLPDADVTVDFHDLPTAASLSFDGTADLAKLIADQILSKIEAAWETAALPWFYVRVEHVDDEMPRQGTKMSHQMVLESYPWLLAVLPTHSEDGDFSLEWTQGLTKISILSTY